MSSTSAPFGLRPSFSTFGVTREPWVATILTGYASNILQNQPVRIAADGSIEAAAIGDRFVGVFQGVSYTDSGGKRQLSNQWTASTAATEVEACITRDPSIIYQIQSSATIALADIGSQADFTVITAGAFGYSKLMLDQATLTNSGSASLRIMGIASAPDNAFGDTYVILNVQIAEHQDVADRVGY